jgi:hypothetical protein
MTILPFAVSCNFEKGESSSSKSEISSIEIVDSSTLNMERTNFYGVCNSIFEFEKFGKADYKETIAIMKALGVQSIRLWMHCDFVMKDPNTLIQEDVKLMKKIIAEIQKENIEIIGMNHHWFSGGSDTMAVPSRDTKTGSAYNKFLLNYDQTWYNLVKTFPEIKIWEIGNEWNNDMFLHPYEYKTKGFVYTFSEKVNISTDMLYYASRGIHRADANKITMLGGLVHIYETGFGNAKNFLKKIYENIKSGDWPSIDPDRYFQTISWHPYNLESDVGDGWVKSNLDIYNVVKEFEGHNKPVYFTEMGWTDYGNAESDENQAIYMEHAVNLIKEKMPFVKSVHMFTLFNDQTAASWGGQKEVNFGLMQEPKLGFYPKEKGKMFQKLAGGTGNLYQFENRKNK